MENTDQKTINLPKLETKDDQDKSVIQIPNPNYNLNKINQDKEINHITHNHSTSSPSQFNNPIPIPNQNINLNNQKKSFPTTQPNLPSQTQDTKEYIEEMKKGTYNILVTVRCRPLSQKEKEQNPKSTIKILNRKIVILDQSQSSNLSNQTNNPLNNNNRLKEQTLAFDYAFDENETQTDIFNCTTKFLLDGVVNGYNATVFAYGATGAGKTYTMLGNEENPGIMPLTLKELFNKIKSYKNEREYTVKLWYLEIYNENIRDLLSNNDEYLDLREDPNKGVIISNIKEITATSSEHILQILKKGNKNRTTESTNANETSSRSHAILQILVSYKEINTGIDYEIKYGKLSLIDLAGSERASATLNRGIRLIEGANINRSLLTLGNCINALCEANEKGIKTYVPYRDSKLTRLLKDSLGGNARTVMIANVSPFAGTFDDTYNTLKYANRAKNIKTNIQRNVLNAQYHISNYVNIIKNLQNKITELEFQIGKKRERTTSPKSIKKEKDKDDGLNCSGSIGGINIINKGEGGYIGTNTVNDIGGVRDNINNNNSNSNSCNNNTEIEKYLESFKSLCENQCKFKQAIISEQLDIYKLIYQIKKDHNEICNTDNNVSNININEEDERKNKVKNMKKKWDKDIQIFKEMNNKIENYINLATIPTTNNNTTNTINSNNPISSNESSSQNTFKDLLSSSSETIKNYYDLLMKSYKSRITNLDLKFKIVYLKHQMESKDKYITSLEEQIRLRDNLLSKNNITPNTFDDETRSKYRTLTQLKKSNYLQYNLNPINSSNNIKQEKLTIDNLDINNTKTDKMNNINNINNVNSNISIMNSTEGNVRDLSFHLPPLSIKPFEQGHVQNVHSILSDLREMRNNLNLKFQNLREKEMNDLKNIDNSISANNNSTICGIGVNNISSNNNYINYNNNCNKLKSINKANRKKNLNRNLSSGINNVNNLYFNNNIINKNMIVNPPTANKHSDINVAVYNDNININYQENNNILKAPTPLLTNCNTKKKDSNNKINKRNKIKTNYVLDVPISAKPKSNSKLYNFKGVNKDISSHRENSNGKIIKNSFEKIKFAYSENNSFCDDQSIDVSNCVGVAINNNPIRINHFKNESNKINDSYSCNNKDCKKKINFGEKKMFKNNYMSNFKNYHKDVNKNKSKSPFKL